MNVTLPPALQRWVKTQVEARGFDTADELIRDMIRRERERTLRYQIDEKLLAAMKTPVSEMTDKDWDDIRRQGSKASGKRNKA